MSFGTAVGTLSLNKLQNNFIPLKNVFHLNIIIHVFLGECHGNSNSIHKCVPVIVCKECGLATMIQTNHPNAFNCGHP